MPPGGHVVGQEQRVTFAKPLLDHLFDASVAVINPDRCAFLVNAEVPYFRDGTTPAPDERPRYELLANRLTYFFPKPDFVNEPAAEHISMPSGTTRVVKHRLEVVNVTRLPAVLETLQEKSGADAVREHLQLEARQRTDEALLRAAVVVLKPAEFRALLQTRLAERPVLVEWHRYYQQLMQTQFPDHDLTREYRNFLAAEPESGALHYLLGRVVSEEEQPACWQAALEAKQSCAYAHNAMGFDAMSNAEFQAAVEHFDASTRAGVPNLSLRHYRHTAYLALGRADIVLGELAQIRKADPLDLQLAAEEMCATYALSPEQTSLAKVKDTYFRVAKARGLSASELADPEAFLDAEIAYLTGDLVSYAKLVARLDSPYYKFRAAVCARQLRQAEQSLGESPDQSAEPALLLFLLATQQNDAAAAERNFQRALAALQKGDRAERGVAALVLAGPADAAAICRVHLALETKLLLLTALGVHSPADREVYFEMARKLNFSPEFPHHLLASVLKS